MSALPWIAASSTSSRTPPPVHRRLNQPSTERSMAEDVGAATCGSGQTMPSHVKQRSWLSSWDDRSPQVVTGVRCTAAQRDRSGRSKQFEVQVQQSVIGLVTLPT